MHDESWSSLLQDTAGGEILHSSKEEPSQKDIFQGVIHIKAQLLAQDVNAGLFSSH